MMGCSVHSQSEGFVEHNGLNTGIMAGHAYNTLRLGFVFSTFHSIIDVFELPFSESEKETRKNYHNNHRMLRIRNPWGWGEWTLKWSETSEYRCKLMEFMPMIR